MKIKLIIVTLLSLVLASTLLLGRIDQTRVVGQQFRYKGEPIHPKLVKEFIPWVSDEKPITISVDIAAAFETNEYYADVIIEKDGYIKFQEDQANFGYKWLGELDNGIHVIRTFDRMMGGSGVFQDLLFIRFYNQKFDLHGETYEQVIMTLVKSYRLGDRTHPEINLLDNRVVINKPLDYDKEVIIQF